MGSEMCIRDRWNSTKLLKDGRTSAIGIDTGIYLQKEGNPRITAIELSSGKIISQKRVDVN